MQECPYLSVCSLFQKFRIQNAKSPWIQMYCSGDFEKCKRKQAQADGQTPPISLLPNGNYFAPVRRK